jgi:hypothetical protein
MRISGKKLAVLATASAVLLGGCGDAPYELTESETNIIVNYAAHVAMKYDLNQKEGLQFVWLETEEDTESFTEEPETETQEDVTETESKTGTAGSSAADAAEGSASLQELFGTDALSVEYAGASLITNYVESTYYALNAEAGKQYLVLNITLTNNGDTDIEVDNLTPMPVFRVESAETGKISEELTVLSEDFSTYQGSIGAGETQNTVLLFLVPDTVTDENEFSLSVSIDGTSYEIIL